MSTGLRVRRRECSSPGNWPDHVPPLLRRIFAARGAVELGHAQPKLAQLLPPEMLGGMDAATALLADAMARDLHIVVVGDFDCDGATACAVGVRGLRMLGAQRVTPAVPNRMVHGYGLSPALVEELAAMKPDLLVTVDHGIACLAGIAAAKARGWQVLVTDHHLPGETLPDADAIVNPNLRGDPFPSKVLAGVGVIFYVLLALRRTLRQRGVLPQPEPDLGALLDLVAVGTVADLVALDMNNRALVGAGLRRLRAGQGNAGLRALIEVSGRDSTRLTTADIGFAIGPRLNAAGRLEDMAIGIECLLCDDDAQARELALLLHRINAERRSVQQSMTADADAALADSGYDTTSAVPHALCLFDEDWHPGVVGLVASKMKEKLHRPVVAFAPAEPGSSALRGSARSIPGFHIRDALANVEALHPGLMGKFGGHAMAAGLSLELGQLDRFHAAFLAQATVLLDDSMLHAELLSDGELEPHEMDHASAEALRSGATWGQGFPEPVFDGEFEVIDWRLVGERHLKLTLRMEGRREPLGAIHFGGWRERPPASRVLLAYRLVPDNYRGGTAIQLIVEHLAPAPLAVASA
jgi:single-stranded-DNA-specific exonuclease